MFRTSSTPTDKLPSTFAAAVEAKSDAPLNPLKQSHSSSRSAATKWLPAKRLTIRSRYFLVFVAGVSLHWLCHRPDHTHTSTISTPGSVDSPVIRDPYAHPGYLNVSLTNALETQWIPHTDAHRAPDWLRTLRTADNSPIVPWPDWNGAIPSFKAEPWQKRELDELHPSERSARREEALTTVSSLKNSTILLIGDSVDRNFVDQFSWLTQAVHGQESFDGQPFDEKSIKSWGLPHTAIIGSEVNLKVANLFFYGSMDEDGVFSSAPDWLPPSKAEDRIETLFKPYSERQQYPVGLIQFSAGLWDLAYFGRQDKTAGIDTNHPLSATRLRQWRARTRSVIRKIKQTWPGVPIVYRKMHRVGDELGPSSDYGGSTNFFTSLRCHQMRHMQDVVAKEEGIAVWDFGQAFEGYQKYQDKVHPYLNPGGVLMTQALLHQLHLAKTTPQFNSW